MANQLEGEEEGIEASNGQGLVSSKRKKVIRSLVFLKTKEGRKEGRFDGLGRLKKIKGRLCTNGADQNQKLYKNLSSAMI
jgi:hypothetical protein